MELNDLNKVSRSSKLNKLLSTRFGFGFDLSKMNEDIANQMIKTAKREMAEETEGKKYMMSKVVLETVFSMIQRSFRMLIYNKKN